MEYAINTSDIRRASEYLRAGDIVSVSGFAYTARDAAHKLLCEMLARGQSLPFELRDAVIYYAGPTPNPPGRPIGSCGPTTSARMDAFADTLYKAGAAAAIGKGGVGADVLETIKQIRAVYFCAIGGAGALAARHITACETVCFEDLGCEAVRRIVFGSFPAVVAADAFGGCIFSGR